MSVTVVITSCNRQHLLEKTLDSFLKYNTYPIDKYIIVEDSGKFGINDFVYEKIKDKSKVELIYNEKNLGQIQSIDIAYSNIKTEYIFHCEDDWEFLDFSFIELSKQILEKDPNIFTVWLRAHNDTSLHPIIKKDLGGYYLMNPNYTYSYKNTTYTWCGFTLNPGLRRNRDCLLFYPYCNIKEKNKPNYIGEYDLNNKYRLSGFYVTLNILAGMNIYQDLLIKLFIT
jgi:GT2 family glycosyltransferase